MAGRSPAVPSLGCARDDADVLAAGRFRAAGGPDPRGSHAGSSTEDEADQGGRDREREERKQQDDADHQDRNREDHGGDSGEQPAERTSAIDAAETVAHLLADADHPDEGRSIERGLLAHADMVRRRASGRSSTRPTSGGIPWISVRSSKTSGRPGAERLRWEGRPRMES